VSNDEPWVYDPEEWGARDGARDECQPPVTQVIEESHILHEPITKLLLKQGHLVLWGKPLYLVTDHRWSGYSEYTITSQWAEVHVHHNGVDLHYDDMGAFLRAMLDANPSSPLS
jgi:hypothetical protein